MAGAVRGASRLPLVVILGATGTGKSKLALEIARIFNGQIISADSMQVYKGLDIVTNKVTKPEQMLCPHHMLDFISPLRSTYSVVEFRNNALTINDLLNKKVIPVIVGGTNYYIEALLWKFLIDSESSQVNSLVEPPGDESVDHSIPESAEGGSTAQTEEEEEPSTHQYPLPENEKCASKSTDAKEVGQVGYKETSCVDDKGSKFSGISSEELHEKLSKVDPTTALQLHPKNRRKIIRALEVQEQHGVPMSQILHEQHQLEGASQVSGPLRYPHPCIIWMRCEQKVLDERTDKRVDSMLEQGLIDELKAFHKEYNQQRLADNRPADYTLGIFQSIGFKEFHSYLLLSAEDQEKPMGKLLLQEGLEEMKRVTRRYARKQNKWIVNRFLKRRGANVPAVYGVDATDPAQWLELVHNPAVSIVQAFIEGKEPSVSPLPYEENTNPPIHNVCHACGGLIFVTAKDWQAHLKGRRHKKALRRRDGGGKRPQGGGQADSSEPRNKQGRLDTGSDVEVSDSRGDSHDDKPEEHVEHSHTASHEVVKPVSDQLGGQGTSPLMTDRSSHH